MAEPSESGVAVSSRRTVLACAGAACAAAAGRMQHVQLQQRRDSG
jgi:hypothetical protein